MLEKARAKNKKPKSSAGMSSIPNITVGTQVRDKILTYVPALILIVFHLFFEFNFNNFFFPYSMFFPSQVCLRNNPLYHAGAVAFSVSAGIPKVGVLLESVWNMNDSCRFQLRSPESLKTMEKTAKTQEIKWVQFLSGRILLIKQSSINTILYAFFFDQTGQKASQSW